jgi:hypothetical protein
MIIIFKCDKMQHGMIYLVSLSSRHKLNCLQYHSRFEDLRQHTSDMIHLERDFSAMRSPQIVSRTLLVDSTLGYGSHHRNMKRMSQTLVRVYTVDILSRVMSMTALITAFHW